ncbi:uracil-DNA glycosylase [Candidatus Woesebacteria bacterium]|nr:uracil-DNA glycosylase [Candidatus Woesebacteria bacterium]
MADVQIESSWKKALADEFEKDYFRELVAFVRQEYLSKTIYPPPADVFRAFALCPFDQVRVVIVGQDPYHGAGQANGLSFAVSEKTTIPPSLRNIFKEIENDLGVQPLQSGDLSRWATQGVLLLNAVLTVQANTPASHKEKGWEQFTDAVIRTLATQKTSLVYLLWGKYAQEKGAIIDREANLVLESAHPSPFSATKFHGNHHFSQCNTYLALQGLSGIDWR